MAVASAAPDPAALAELLSDVELGLGNSVHVNAYRIAGLVPGSLSLILADHLSWGWVFLITALFMLPGVLALTVPMALSKSEIAEWIRHQLRNVPCHP